jgi:hypothetical protein
MRILRLLAEFTIVAILMFMMAYLYLEAWDRTEFVDQARRANTYVGRGF